MQYAILNSCAHLSFCVGAQKLPKEQWAQLCVSLGFCTSNIYIKNQTIMHIFSFPMYFVNYCYSGQRISLCYAMNLIKRTRNWRALFQIERKKHKTKQQINNSSVIPFFKSLYLFVVFNHVPQTHPFPHLCILGICSLPLHPPPQKNKNNKTTT